MRSKFLVVDYSQKEQTYSLREKETEESRFGRRIKADDIHSAENLLLPLYAHLKVNPQVMYTLQYSPTSSQLCTSLEKKILEGIIELHNLKVHQNPKWQKRKFYSN